MTNGKEGDQQDFPQGWTRTTMASLGLLVCGTSPPAAEVNKDGTGTPYVTGPEQWDGSTLHMDKWTTLPRKVVGPGHIFITVKGAGVGKLFPGKPAAIGRDIYAFKPNDLIDWRFVEHALRFTIQDVITQARGDIPGLSRTHILDHWINVPPAPEQSRIADRIEELFADLDAGVSALLRVQKKLKRYRAALLHAAVTGRLTADWRAKHGDCGESGTELLARILQARREDWEQRTLADYEAKERKPPKSWKTRYREPENPVTDGLAELPTGWIWTTLDQISNVTGGVAKNKKAESAADRVEIAYLRVANVQRGFLDLTQIKTIRATDSDIRDLQLRRGDVLMTEGGDRDKLGRGWIWEEQIEECIHQNHVFRARLLLDDCESRLVSHAANGYGREWFMNNGKQSVNLASISLGQLRRFPFPLAPVAEQSAIADAISEKVSSIDAMESEVERGLRRASRLRQAILKAGFEGKLVPQNSDDEPASELLARIQAEAEAEIAAAPKRSPRKRKAAKKKTTKAKASR